MNPNEAFASYSTLDEAYEANYRLIAALPAESRAAATTIPFTLSGIPCQIAVTDFRSVRPWRGSPQTCPSAADYYGYTEYDYTILDRKGYPAPWLSRKINSEIEAKIHEAVVSFYSRSEED